MRYLDPLLYDQVWANIAARAPESEREARRRRQTAERLRAELLDGPPATWLDRLADERFCNRDLFEHLLEICHQALPFEASLGFEVSVVALELGRLLSERSSDTATIETLCRALCLGSHARRLIGKPELAELLLMRAAYLAEDPASLGFFCRSYALLRWDQGRMEEAAALLEQGRRRYRELGDTREESACEALLGLLYHETGELARAENALHRARSGLDSRRNPWLMAQVNLALARCLGLTNRKAEARALRESAWSLYRCTPMEEATCSLLWLEAQVAEALGDLEDAETLFETVRRKFIARGCLPEATLSTVQLAVILASQGRGEETPALAAELAAVFGGRKGFDLTLNAIHLMAAETAGGGLDPEVWHLMTPSYLLSFRIMGVSPRPVPFV